MRYFLRFLAALVWHWHNAVALGAVALTVWGIGPPTKSAVLSVLGGTLVLAAFRLAWTEYWRNRGLSMSLEWVYLGDTLAGVLGTPILIFGVVTNTSGLGDQADKWRLTYRLPGTWHEIRTEQVRSSADIAWGPQVIKPAHRLDIKAFRTVPARSAVRGYMLFSSIMSAAELPDGTRLTLSFRDLAGDEVRIRKTITGTRKPDFTLPLGMED